MPDDPLPSDVGSPGGFVPEYFVPDPDRPGWMLGANSVRIKGQKWILQGRYEEMMKQKEASR